MKISATIITRNEERHIARCLESIRGLVDEVLVVDARSEDQTREIALSLGATVLEREWTNYSDQKNFAAAQSTHPWILSLDADECLSQALNKKLIQLKAGTVVSAAYAFPRKTHYLGRWIKHSGWYPDYKIRLYLKEKGHWTGEYVHETLVVDGPVSIVNADLLHYTCDAVSDHLQRQDRYTSLAAEDLWKRGKRASFWTLLGSPMGAFLKTYFLKAGFLDGVQGMIIAGFAAYYNFLKYAKLWDKEMQLPRGR
jgi:glycosyltransferase involved in cell wall biosynthesis